MGDCCDSVALLVSSTTSSKNPKFQCLFPKNRHLKKYADQLETFTESINWPGARIKATCREFADAGFYYLGDRDRVKCFYCNGGLKNWEPTDDPFQEHAKWYPLCEYILKKRGVEFVKNEVKKYRDLKRPIITNPASVQLVGDLMKYLKPQPELQTSLAFTNSRKLKMWQSINNEMDHGENVRILKTLGFGEAKIRRILTQRYEEHDNNFYNFEDFLQALLDAPEDQQMTLAEARKIVEEEGKCKRCKKEERDVVFKPCKHLGVCFRCSEFLTRCNICDVKIDKKVRVYRS